MVMAATARPRISVMEYFRLRAGFETVPVPYRGGAPLVADFITGQFKAAFGSTSGLLPQVAAGKLRALAVSTANVRRSLPDVPAVAEYYPGSNPTTDFVLLAPGGTPDEIVALLERRSGRRSTRRNSGEFPAAGPGIVGSTAA